MKNNSAASMELYFLFL